MNRWKTIWNTKKTEKTDSILNTLLRANGYDTVFGELDETNFLSNIQNIRESLNIKENDSLFEVGCGAGAVLYPFHKQGYKVAGLDYSAPLIELAKHVMPDADFECKDADQLETSKTMDIVFSFGVFIYFENYDYAETVLRKMVIKAKKTIGIFDISDLELKTEAEKLRREEMGTEEYEIKYQGLPHLYYPKSFFQKLADGLKCDICILPQAIEGYKNSAYRYNVVLFK